MKESNDKNIDIEIFLFYSGISLISFLIFIIKHPIKYLLKPGFDYYPLILAYLPDLLLFMAVLIPYLIIIIYFIFKKMTNKYTIPENAFIILFFPIFSFFFKGMSLISVYSFYTLFDILKENIAFFSFLLAGPAVVLFNKIFVYNYKKYFRK